MKLFSGSGPNKDWVSKATRKRWDEIDRHIKIKTGEDVKEGHVGLAALISATIANLAAGDPPAVTAADPEDQIRLDAAWREQEMDERTRALFDELSTVGGVLVGVTLREEAGSLGAVIRIVSERHAILTFAGERLTEVTLVDERIDNKRKIKRHLETHTPGRIEHKFYVNGDAKSLGHEVKTDEDFGGNILKYTNGGVIETGIDSLLFNYIRNRRQISSPYGLSDYAGNEQAFEELDEINARALNNYRLTGVTIFATDESLPAADMRAKDAWAGVRVIELEGDPDSVQYKVDSPDPRTKQWIDLVTSKIDEILMTHRVAGQSVGREQGGGATSGEARRMMIKQTVQEVSAKARAVGSGLAKTLRLLAQIEDRWGDESWTNTEGLPSIAFSTGAQLDLTEISRMTISEHKAGLRSLEASLRLINPSWSDEQISDEAARLREESPEDQSEGLARHADAAAGAV